MHSPGQLEEGYPVLLSVLLQFIYWHPFQAGSKVRYIEVTLLTTVEFVHTSLYPIIVPMGSSINVSKIISMKGNNLHFREMRI